MRFPDAPSLTRRHFTRSAAFGATAFLASFDAPNPSLVAENQILNVRLFGAKGDGKTDDTVALQHTIDLAAERQGAVFLPPGDYLTSELLMRPGIAVLGVPAWNYWEAGGSILRLASSTSSCLLNLTNARGATIDGLALDGRNLGENVHGMFINRTAYPDHEDGIRIERCQVIHFSGDALHFSRVWVLNLRHSMLAHNRGDGLNLRGWDSFILDNWLSDNGKAGFAARYENEGAAVTFTGNRVEWNKEENMLVVGSDSYQITGNFFDRAGTCGLALRRGPKFPFRQSTITGNIFRRSGKFARSDSHDSSHIFLDDSWGVTCTGNNFMSGRDDGDKGVFSPSYGIVYKSLQSCVIANNVLHDGALRELLVDLGNDHEQTVVRDNPGQLFQASTDSRTSSTTGSSSGRKTKPTSDLDG